MNRLIPVIIECFLFSLFPFTGAVSQETEFTAAVNPDVLTAGEQFSLIFSSNERIEEVSVPELPDFQFLGGPMRSESRSVQMTGGKVVSVANYEYILYYMALKEGRFTIPPATARIGNRQYKSNPVTLQVAAGKSMQEGPGSAVRSDEPAGEIDQNNLFIRLIPDKSDIYIGEPLQVTVKLSTRVDLSGYDPGFKGPDLQGFFTEVENSQGNITREVYNGIFYNTAVIRTYYTIPQKTGEIVLEPFAVDVGVRQEVSRRIPNPLFDDFFFPDIEEIPVTLASRSLKINVKPLPPGAPSTFTGAVGSYTITSSITSPEINVNDPLTLKYTIKGTGNIKLVNEIKVEFPPDIETYEPVLGTSMDGPVKGSRSFEYMLIPHAPGTYNIPEVAFSYFDPSKDEYATAYSDPYIVNVTGQPGNIATGSGIIRNEVEVLSNDIRYIKVRNIRLKLKDGYFAGSGLYYLLMALISAAFIAALTVRKNINIRESDLAGLRKRKADKYAARRLKNCSLFLEQGKHKEFYDELLSALWKYMADKLNIPMAILSRETAGKSLSAVIDDKELAERFFSIIDECEAARYSQNSFTLEPNKLFTDAKEIISRLQQKLK